MHLARDAGPYGRRRDAAVIERLRGADVAVHATGSPYTVMPGTVRKADGQPYRVFTPFSRAWADAAHRRRTGASPDVDWRTICSDPLPAAPEHAPELPAIGEAARRTAGTSSSTARSRRTPRIATALTTTGTSELSADLRWGVVHPSRLLDRHAPRQARPVRHRAGLAGVLRRRAAAPAPSRRGTTWIATMDAMAVDTDAAAPTAVRALGDRHAPASRSSMPACASCCATGWMHNRVRMVTASFLVKDLHLPWWWGARHFLRAPRRRRPGVEQPRLAVGGRHRHRRRAVLPRVQPRRAGGAVRSRRRLHPPVGARSWPASPTRGDPRAGRRRPPRGYPAPIVDHRAERVEALRRYALSVTGPQATTTVRRALALGSLECQPTFTSRSGRRSVLDERKTAILRAVVQEYIATAQPVGSTHDRQRARGAVSARPRCATRWPCSSRRATSSSRTRRPGGSPPTRATASSSTTSPRPGRLDAAATAAGRRVLRHRPRRARGDAPPDQPPARRSSRTTPPWSSARAPSAPSCARCSSSGCRRSRHRRRGAVATARSRSATIELPTDTSDDRLAAATAHLAGALVGQHARPGADRAARAATPASTRCAPPALDGAASTAPADGDRLRRRRVVDGPGVRRGRHGAQGAAHPRAAVRRRVAACATSSTAACRWPSAPSTASSRSSACSRGRRAGRRRRRARRHGRRARPDPDELPAGAGRRRGRQRAARRQPVDGAARAG